MRSTDLATDAANEPSTWPSYVPGPTPWSVVARSGMNRCPLLRMLAPELAPAGSTEARFGSYAPAPGVSWLRAFARCADDERNDALGIWPPSDISLLPRYEPGPGVSSPMMSSFMSRADDAPNAPEPARFDRPKERADMAASPLALYASYAPGSPVSSSAPPRRDPLLKAAAYPLALLGAATLYAPGPGVADLRDSRALIFAAWNAARSDGVAPRAESDPEPIRQKAAVVCGVDFVASGTSCCRNSWEGARDFVQGCSVLATEALF